jgi:hypothetical protein
LFAEVAPVARKRQFRSPDWRGFAQRFPDGLHDQVASVRAVRVIVTSLQHAMTPRGFLIALDETEIMDDVPEAIILSDGGTTTLIHLSFRRPKLVHVANAPVYVAHAGGFQMLADAITSEVRKALH